MKKTVFITGGTRGIGLGIAKALADEGCNLALCGMRPASAVQDVVEEVQAMGVEVLYVQCDVSRAADHQKALDVIKDRFGALHVLINNAGIAPKERQDILEADEDVFEQVLKTNLQGPYFLTQKTASWLIEQRQQQPDFAGCIINVTSVSARLASVQRGEYCISKAGLSMSTQLWAFRLAEYGIPVYEIQPGITETDMTSGVKEKYDAMIDDGLLVQKRWGQPADMGKAAAMLVRGDLPYSTGQVLAVDGGMMLPRL